MPDHGGLRLGFAGTPEFARAALVALAGAGFDIALVLTQPDRPAGRGMKLHDSPVKAEALALGLPLIQPRSLGWTASSPTMPPPPEPRSNRPVSTCWWWPPTA